MKSNRILYIILFVLFIVAVLITLFYANKIVSLSLVPEPDVEHPTQKRLHFVLIAHEKDNPYWESVREGAYAAADKYGVHVEYLGPVRANVQDHIQLVDMSIAAQVDGILTQGLTEEGFTPVINKAIDKNIPVILIDTDAPNSNRHAYIGTNNYEAGYLAGLKMIELLGGKGKVGVITGSFQAENMNLRTEGFKKALELAPEIELVAIESSEISQVEAEEKTLKMLKENPDINGIFGNSALDGIGIVKALNRLDRSEDVKVVAFDTLPETLSLLTAGEIDAIITQEPYEMGYRGVEKLLEVNLGVELSGMTITTRSSVITHEDMLQRADKNYDNKK